MQPRRQEGLADYATTRHGPQLDEGIAQPFVPVRIGSGGSAELHEETIWKSVVSRYCSSQETAPQKMGKSTVCSIEHDLE